MVNSRTGTYQSMCNVDKVADTHIYMCRFFLAHIAQTVGWSEICPLVLVTPDANYGRAP